MVTFPVETNECNKLNPLHACVGDDNGSSSTSFCPLLFYGRSSCVVFVIIIILHKNITIIGIWTWKYTVKGCIGGWWQQQQEVDRGWDCYEWREWVVKGWFVEWNWIQGGPWLADFLLVGFFDEHGWEWAVAAGDWMQILCEYLMG